MSHSSGIPVSEGLLEEFGKARQGTHRIIKIKIEDDTMVSAETLSASGSWEDDFDLIAPLLEEASPCYIIYRLDEQNEYGYPFALLCYVPDKAKVNQKMVYASSRSNLKQKLGATYIADEIFGTVPADFTREGYAQYKQVESAEAPLTKQEEERQLELEQTGVYSGGASTYIHGVSFPIASEVISAMSNLKSGSINYAQLSIDPVKEEINLEKTEDSLDINLLKSNLPADEPRFHFYSWSHNHEGQDLTSIIYIYSCPDGSGGTQSSPVKLRMLYSSSKANVENVATSNDIQIDLKMEINSPSELTEEIISNELHPPPVEEKKKFSRPAPAGGGARRAPTRRNA